MKIIVNDETISDLTIKDLIQKMSEAFPNVSEKGITDRVHNDLIRQAIIRQETKKNAFDISQSKVDDIFLSMKSQNQNFSAYTKGRSEKDVEVEIKKDIEMQLQVETFFDSITKSVNESIDENEMKEYYDKHSELVTLPEKRHASHIVKQVSPQNAINTYNELKKIREDLIGGADFAKIADLHSSCSEKSGDLGLFERGKMVEEFDVIVFSMNKDEISPIFQTKFGYHIVKLHRIELEKLTPFEESKELIKRNIIASAKNKKLNTWYQKIREKSKIKFIK